EVVGRSHQAHWREQQQDATALPLREQRGSCIRQPFGFAAGGIPDALAPPLTRVDQTVIVPDERGIDLRQQATTELQLASLLPGGQQVGEPQPVRPPADGRDLPAFHQVPKSSTLRDPGGLPAYCQLCPP